MKKIIYCVLFIPFLAIIYQQSTPISFQFTDDEITSGIMNFSMPHIIKRCQKDFNYTDEDMVILEHELKRYFILCALKKDTETMVNMYSVDVDNLWHSFILFTKEYDHFCNSCVGYFIHHMPKINDTFTQEDIVEGRKDFRLFIEMYENTFKEDIHPIWLLDRCL